jgi:hypothetical protein
MNLKTLLLFVSTSLLCTFGYSQTTDNCHLDIGINLAGPTDYGSEWPFVNIMKYGRTWETTNIEWTAGGQNLWNTQLLDYFEFDEQGYPLEVPLDIDHPNADNLQMIRSVWANTDALPEGTYVILYDGQGVIDVAFDATILSQSPGRIEVEVTHGGNIMALLIRESVLGDHIRNIRFLLPGTEATHEEQIWTQSWLDKLEPFKALRFMDWGHTNNSPLTEWSARPQLDDYTYTPNGIPYERWMEICNMNQADAWVCIPHLADDNYIAQMATLFRDQLDPNQKIYVEYSNELWNWLFAQAQYGESQLDQSLPWPERLAPRIAHVMQIWTDVFGDQSDRLVRVMGGQHGWFDIGNRIFAQIEADGHAHLIDAISPAGYMSPDHGQLATLGAAATPQDVISGAAALSFDNGEWLMQGWRQHAQLAADHGKRLIFYEAGQHFTPDPWGTVQPYNMALLDAQVAPEMYTLYERMLDTIAGLSDEDMLLMHFSFIAPLGDEPADARWGSFGALTSQFFEEAPYPDAPKYRVLTEHIAGCATATSTTFVEKESLDFQVFPNPIHADELTIQLETPFSGTVQLWQSDGKMVQVWKVDNIVQQTFALPKLPKGVYQLHLVDEQGALKGVKQVIR